ncbi:MAG: family 43 glycosylhydrolase [Bacteroidota bacterium]
MKKRKVIHSRLTGGFILLLLVLHSQLFSQTLTYCNPVDIDYKYNFEQLNEGISYRSGADPVIVPHGDGYALFVTISGGWWYSRDLKNWDYVSPSMWPMEDICAPAAISVGDTLYLFQSTFELRPIFFMTDPSVGLLRFFNRLMPPLRGAKGPWDPALFRDDDGRWYMYFGSSNVYPLYGIELDPHKRLTYIGEAQPLFSLHPEEHGWERFGQDHRDTITPFIEGAWMTKYGGKYYLQYGAPGTEYNVYANGTYVADHPLGPFTYAPYNPVSYKPGGFVQGAGHGNTFQDHYGNYWNTGTPWIAVNWNFERRIAMFPAGFDESGQMYSDTRFGDFPHFILQDSASNSSEFFTGWMLLSYKKPVTASSVMDGFLPERLCDENPRTFWVAAANDTLQYVTIDLKKSYDIKAIQVNYTDYQSDIFENDSTVRTCFRLFTSPDGRNWELFADLSDETRDRPNAYVEAAKPVRGRYIRYQHIYVASPNLAISDIRVFGGGEGRAPAVPGSLRAVRDADPRNVLISWEPVKDAVGYNIRWGIAPGKLYQTWQRFADQGKELEIRALNEGVSYYFAIEAFNENGVSALSGVVKVE